MGVLLIEDDPMDAELFTLALREANYEEVIYVKETAEKAMEFLLALPDELKQPYGIPKLVVLDLVLPGIDGFGFLRWLRSHPSFKALPVLVLTSSKEEEDCKRAYEAGANGYLVKPSSFKEMREIAKAIRSYWLTYNKTPWEYL